MMKCVIIAHGSADSGQILKKECRDADLIICADGGADYAMQSSIVPDILIGDLDSISSDVLSYFTQKDVRIEKYPVEKDYTDTEICIEKAINLGASMICIASGVGGRIDHSLGNIFLLSSMANKGIEGYIATDHEYVYICRGEISIRGHIGDIISIIPLSSTARGLHTRGLKYSLTDGEIPFGRALGISNLMTSESCAIRISEGEILVIKTKNI